MVKMVNDFGATVEFSIIDNRLPFISVIGDYWSICDTVANMDYYKYDDYITGLQTGFNAEMDRTVMRSELPLSNQTLLSEMIEFARNAGFAFDFSE